MPEPTPPNSYRAPPIVTNVPDYAPKVITVNEKDDRTPDIDLDWLDQVAPLPVRPSSCGFPFEYYLRKQLT